MARRWRAAVALVCLIAVAGCSHSHADLTKASTQDSFGVQMARMNLWREAMFRFQRAVEINPNDAMAHNNLAVAYEANGDFDKAAKEYREALKLDRSNQYIQKNYSRYTEFMARNRKRQQRQEAKTAAKDTPPATGTAATPIIGIPATTPATAAGATPATTPAATESASTAAPAATASPTPTTTTAAPATPATSTAPPATATAPVTPSSEPAAAPSAPAAPPSTPPSATSPPANTTTAPPQTPPPQTPPPTPPPTPETVR